MGPPSGAIPGGNPHLLKPPPPQVCGAVHVPHWISPPHPSEAPPQVYPSAAHVVGTHDETGPPSALIPGGNPHLLKPPPPQVCGAVHVPHWRSPPQLSDAGPQVYPSAAHVVG